MKKISLLSVLLSVSMFYVYPACSAEKDYAALLAQTLSSSYGEPVKVEMNEQNCRVTYPQVTMEETVSEYIAPTKEGEQPRVEQKTETIVVPETQAVCSKAEDFNGMPQFKIAHNSPHKLVAQVYNLSKLTFLKDIEMKTFDEEFVVAPDIGLISSSKVHIADAAYTEKDATTGLKSELGGLKDFKFTKNVKQQGDKVIYQTDSILDTLNVALPLFSLQIQSDRQAAEVEYTVPQGKEFHHLNLWQSFKDALEGENANAEVWKNFEYLTSSKSKAVAKGIKFTMDFLNFGMLFDLNTNNYAKINQTGSLDSVGNLVLDNVVFSGQMVEPSKQFKSVTFKYTMNGMNIKKFVQFAQMQQELANSEQEVDAEVFAKIMDEVMETVVMTTDINIQFANAGVDAHLNMQRKNNYLYGDAHIRVRNLYNIFPEQRQCVNNPLAETIPECSEPSILSELKDLIDITKDNPETVIKFNETGIYRGDVKIGEPVLLNFQQMMQEQKAREAERQEKMQQLMQQQQELSNTTGTTE